MQQISYTDLNAAAMFVCQSSECVWEWEAIDGAIEACLRKVSKKGQGRTSELQDISFCPILAIAEPCISTCTPARAKRGSLRVEAGKSQRGRVLEIL